MLVTRPSGSYTPSNAITNTTKYQTDSAATSPRVAISSAKVDGDINKAFDELTNQSNRIDKLDAPVANTASASVASGDVIVFADVSDSNSIKRTTAGDIAALATPANPSGIRQVVSTTKTDTSALTTLDAWTDVTGLSVSITPADASNKVMVMVDMSAVAANTDGKPVGFRLVRGSTAIGVAASAGSRQQASKVMFAQTSGSSSQADNFAMMFVDSPSTTSSTTYKVQYYFPTRLGSETLYINRDATDTDSSSWFRGTSTITVMEIVP